MWLTFNWAWKEFDMTVFEGTVLKQTVSVAAQHKIEPAALLAVVEVESAGKSLEIDGKTPSLLFERHVFYRELKKAGKDDDLVEAVAAGLAIPKWSPSTQYKDQGTSAKRLALFARAKAIDEECAIRSCSWGVGQTCGFLAEEIQFPNAVSMLAYLKDGGVPAQVNCMVLEIESKHLVAKLNGHDWTGFARVYNGPGYASNDYDTKMASAYLKWDRTVLPTPTPIPLPPSPPIPAPVPTTNTKKAGIGAAIAAFFAGLYASLQQVQFEFAVFGIFILALVIITAVVIWRRHRAAKPQLGVLTMTDNDDDEKGTAA